MLSNTAILCDLISKVLLSGNTNVDHFHSIHLHASDEETRLIRHSARVDTAVFLRQYRGPLGRDIHHPPVPQCEYGLGRGLVGLRLIHYNVVAVINHSGMHRNESFCADLC